jgi:uncharacterized membrane protein
MDQAIDFLQSHWLASALLLLALVGALLMLLIRLRVSRWSLSVAILSGTLALFGLGGLFIATTYGFWLAIAALAVLSLMVFTMALTGYWWAPLAWVVASVAIVGAGGYGAGPVGEGLAEAYRFVRNLRPLKPWWLLLLVLIPLIVLLSFRSLSGLGQVRRWVAIGLRCSLVLFLTLALAEAATTTLPENTTVIFVFDGSQSVPKELADRAEKFVNDAVELRGTGHERDRVGLVVFGKQPRLERPPSDAGLLKFKFKEVADSIDGNYTNLSAALKLALASFPEGCGKRIVVISDGNENLGSAKEQGELAKVNGVQIDVVPLATGMRNQNEVLVHSIEAPGLIEQGSQLPIRVLVRSYNANLVVGTLRVQFQKDGVLHHVVGSPRQVTLQLGLNSFTFQQQLEGEDGKAKQIDSQQSYTFEAEFQPLQVVDEKGNVLMKGLPGDRVENNRARTHVVARGQRRVLLIEKKPAEDKPREHEFLAERLAEAGNNKFKIAALTSDFLPKDPDRLALMLSDYDCVVLANVPADEISEQQQEVLRSNTHDQGCGLIMIGGPDSFGAGGWQKTAVEKALPVDCDINSLQVEGKGGLVLIMHASEMADGNMWQKKIAKLAIEKLSPMDEIGVIHFDWGGNKWHIDLQLIGDNRKFLLGQIDKLQPGDMPEVDTALQMAHKALTNTEKTLSTKHVIFISDGDPQQTDMQVLGRMKRDKVTVTTVGVATHGPAQDQSLMRIATATGGRAHFPKSAALLPAIYIKETRLVSQSFIYESKKGFPPQLRAGFGPVEGLPRQLPPLYGFVRTSLKPQVLVESPIMTPQFANQDFPLLAYWHYGLGKGVAFTSDARQLWDRDWARSEMYGKFWEQVLDWSLRPVESKRLTMTTESRDGFVTVRVEARRDDNEPDVRLILRGGVTMPGGKADGSHALRFEQKQSGVYEAKFKAEEAGSYFIDAAAMKREKVVGKDGKVSEREVVTDSVRAGVTIPYSPEFSDIEPNTLLLEELREMTGGKSYSDDEEELARVARSGELFRAGLALTKSLQPIWFWLVFVSCVLLLFDVAVRRIAVDPVQVAAAAQGLWDRLRGTAAPREVAAEFFDRLRSRKALVGQALDQGRAARRFEGDEGIVATAPPSAEDARPLPERQPPPRPAQPAPPSTEEEAGDFASRLMRAKRRAMQEREKRKDS